MKQIDIDDVHKRQALGIAQELMKMNADDPATTEKLNQLIQLLDIPVPSKIYQEENLWNAVIALRDQKLLFEQLRESIKEALK
ncbi:MAG: hypothetical protein WCT03_20670 [Candidatus Obscuribacterales bacterium]